MADRSIKWRPAFQAGATFVKKLIVPNSAGDPSGVVNYEIWVDSTSGKLAFKVGGAVQQIPLASELGSGALTQEQVEDLVQAMFTGADMSAGDITWAYTDNGSGAGTIKGTIKANAIVTALLANDAVTYAKMQNVSATSRFLGRKTTGAGDVEELSNTDALTILGALDAATLGGDSKATIIAAAVSTVLGGAGSAYDTLQELKDLIDAATDATELATAIGTRSRFYAGAIPNGATPQTVTHGLALANMGDFVAKCFVSATGVIEEYEITPTDGNNVSVSDESGTAIPTGRRIFIVGGA
jgi:hypothetical protein